MSDNLRRSAFWILSGPAAFWISYIYCPCVARCCISCKNTPSGNAAAAPMRSQAASSALTRDRVGGGGRCIGKARKGVREDG